jgi:hypothetical protein
LSGGEKEKGRLLAPFLQFRKETAAERSARFYPEEASYDKPCAATAIFVALPRQDELDGSASPTAGPDLRRRRVAVPIELF